MLSFLKDSHLAYLDPNVLGYCLIDFLQKFLYIYCNGVESLVSWKTLEDIYEARFPF